MDAQNFLMGGGVRSARMIVGQPVRLTITDEPEVRQQTDPGDQSLKYFKNGDPMMQLVITGATDQRDPQNPDDDGKRRFYIRGKQLTAAVRDAVKAAGAAGLAVGGALTLTWVSGGPRYEGESPLAWSKDNPKIHTAVYEKPVNTAANTFLAQSDPAPAATPAAAPQNVDLAAVLAQLSPDQRAAFMAQQNSSPGF